MTKTIKHKVLVNLTAVASLEEFSDVPCGTCTLCCRVFTPHLTPTEISSGKYPLGLSNGEDNDPVVTMFRNPETGGCGMFIDGKCSIYEDRPVACRQFTCLKHWTHRAHKYPQETRELEEKWKKQGISMFGSTENTNVSISEVIGEQKQMDIFVHQDGCENRIAEDPVILKEESLKKV